MPRTDQTFSLWMEGDLVATGRNGCDMEFVSNELKTPECSSDMWVAIEAVDAEATSFGGHSKGGIKAAFEWCGQEIHTDDTWECSPSASAAGKIRGLMAGILDSRYGIRSSLPYLYPPRPRCAMSVLA